MFSNNKSVRSYLLFTMVITLKFRFCVVVFVQSGELFERFKFKMAVCGWVLFIIIYTSLSDDSADNV